MGIIKQPTSVLKTVAIAFSLSFRMTRANSDFVYGDDYLSVFANYSTTRNQDISLEMEQSPYKRASFIFGILIVPIAFVGIIGNIVTMFIFTRKSMACSINTLLAGLAGIDCFLLFTGTPVFSMLALYASETLPTILIYLIVYIYPLSMIAQSASVWCMLIITLERYVAVIYPLKARFICTIKNARIASTIVITIAISYNVCRFWEYSLNNNTLCYVLKNNAFYLRFYAHWLYFFVIFFIPFAVLLIFNGLIINELKKARLHRAELTRQQNQEHKIALMMVIVILIFFVCNSLAFVLNAIEATQNENCFVTNECATNILSNHTVTAKEVETTVEVDVRCVSHTDAFFFLVDFNNLLIEINSSVNFIVYYAFSQRYRKHFRQFLPILKECRHRNNSKTRSEINSENINENELRALLSNKSIREPSSIKTTQSILERSNGSKIYTTKTIT